MLTFNTLLKHAGPKTPMAKKIVNDINEILDKHPLLTYEEAQQELLKRREKQIKKRSQKSSIKKRSQ